MEGRAHTKVDVGESSSLSDIDKARSKVFVDTCGLKDDRLFRLSVVSSSLLHVLPIVPARSEATEDELTESPPTSVSLMFVQRLARQHGRAMRRQGPSEATGSQMHDDLVTNGLCGKVRRRLWRARRHDGGGERGMATCFPAYNRRQTAGELRATDSRPTSA